MYKYEIISAISFEVTGDNYKSVFKGDEDKAILVTNGLNADLLKEQKTEKIKLLQTAYQTMFDDFKNVYPAGERASFDDKKREALAWQADDTIPTPICDAISTASHIERVEYLNIIIAKVTFLAGQEGAMIKVRGSIKECLFVDELDAIVIPDFPAI